MKTILKISLASLLLSSFSSKAQNGTYEDDVYYSTKDAQQKALENKTSSDKAPVVRDSNTANKREYNDNQYSGQQNDYNDDSFNYDDYYDYSYAVRLRRFYGPSIGFGYYDPYFTNSYWYTYNPNNWGVSVYLGYNWWGPGYYAYSYNPSYFWNDCWGWGVGVGWGGYYGYNDWGSGYYGYSYYPGWGGYGAVYNRGYRHGYNHGYNSALNDNYYYNSYDNNSHYYGRRNSSPSNGSTPSRPSRSSNGFAQKYQDAMMLETSNKRGVNPNSPAMYRKENEGVNYKATDGNGRENNINPAERNIIAPAGRNNPSMINNEPGSIDNKRPANTIQPAVKQNGRSSTNEISPSAQPGRENHLKPGVSSPVENNKSFDRPMQERNRITNEAPRTRNNKEVSPGHGRESNSYNRTQHKSNTAPINMNRSGGQSVAPRSAGKSFQSTPTSRPNNPKR